MNRFVIVLAAALIAISMSGCCSTSPSLFRSLETRTEAFGGYTMEVPTLLFRDTNALFYHGGTKFIDANRTIEVHMAAGYYGEESFYSFFEYKGKKHHRGVEKINGMRCFIVSQRDSTGCFAAIWPYGAISMTAMSSNPYNLDWMVDMLKTVRKREE